MLHASKKKPRPPFAKPSYSLLTMGMSSFISKTHNKARTKLDRLIASKQGRRIRTTFKTTQIVTYLLDYVESFHIDSRLRD